MNKKLRALSHTLKALQNYKSKKVILDNQPTFIWIEPTNECNLKCIMCPTGQDLTGFKRGFMDYQLYKKIIDEIKSYAASVMLAVSGESLLHPQLCEMIKYAEQNGLRTMLNTNATLLDEKTADFLLDSGLQHINFSFDGYNQDMYEKIRAGANFKKVLDNIMYFLKRKKEKKLSRPYTVLTVLKLNVGSFTQNDLKEFCSKLSGLIDELRVREAFSWGDKFKGTTRFTYFKDDKVFSPCGRLWSSLAIAYNGDIIPCVYDVSHKYVLGNVRQVKLLDAWNSQKIIALRKSMLNKTYLDLLSSCEDCIMIHTDAVLGVPAGIRGVIYDSLTHITGFNLEKYIIRLANFISRGSFTTDSPTLK